MKCYPNDLRHHLETILSCVKSLHATLSAIMADVAAIRKTMFEDTDNIDIFNGHLKQTIATAKPLVDQAMVYYDLQIREIVDSQKREELTLHPMATCPDSRRPD